MYSLRRTVAPTVAPVSLAAFKEYLGVGDDDQDAILLQPLLDSAIKHVEDQAGIVMAPSTWTQSDDCFPGFNDVLCLMRPPVTAVTGISYTDVNGSTQSLDLATVDVDTNRWPAMIKPKPGTYWPQTQLGKLNAVVTTFTAGDSIPHPSAVRAVLLLAGQWFHQREATVVGKTSTAIPLAFDACLNDLRWPQ